MYYGVAAEDLLKEKCLKNTFINNIQYNGNTSTTFTSAYDRIYYLKELVAGKGYELDIRVIAVHSA